MSWFDDQIRQRKKRDNAALEDSFMEFVRAIMGNAPIDSDDVFARIDDAAGQILAYMGFRAPEVPTDIRSIAGRLEYICRPQGIMRRPVKLNEKWYDEAYGSFMAFRKDDGVPVAVLPGKFGGYTFFDVYEHRTVRVTARNCDLFAEQALVFYKPLPLRKLTAKDLISYAFGTWRTWDFAKLLIVAAVIAIMGVVLPDLSYMMVSDSVLKGHNLNLLATTAIFLLALTIGRELFTSFKEVILEGVTVKMSLNTQAAVMMRILTLPTSFFAKFSSGEITQRANYINNLCGEMVSAIFSTSVTSVFSLIYITQVARYAPMLVVPSIGVIAVTVAFSVLTAFKQAQFTLDGMEFLSSERGLTYSLLRGIRKIRLAGAEKRAFAKWAKLFSRGIESNYNPDLFIKINPAVSLAVTLTGTIVMYYFAARSGIAQEEYFAFNTAYGLLAGAFMTVSDIALTAARVRPILEMARPILETEPEVSADRPVISDLKGSIELSHVYFRYSEEMPLVFEDLSLKIRPGQYVAVVGRTGCGKSTLVRLLLGFERPAKGAIYYDGRDINSMDIKSLRRRIGVVLQNDKLFRGDVYSNITQAVPQMTLQEAWEIAEIAGVADDIRKMPMGMSTLISENANGISGGQKQRLLIARAIAPKPKILMFDEATSALDNVTQKRVSEALDSLKCTRLVIAHRLSTIKNCDRILMLDGGHIIEDGTYEKLIAKNGAFAELVREQLADDDDSLLN